MGGKPASQRAEAPVSEKERKPAWSQTPKKGGPRVQFEEKRAGDSHNEGRPLTSAAAAPGGDGKESLHEFGKGKGGKENPADPAPKGQPGRRAEKRRQWMQRQKARRKEKKPDGKSGTDHRPEGGQTTTRSVSLK